MTNAAITWLKHEFGILETEVVAIEPTILAWAKTFLSDITPALKQAATDAVLTAISVPGSGAVKFAAAVTSATADLTSKGIPIVENDLKAAIQIAYKSLPVPVQTNEAAQAIEAKAESEVGAVAAKLNPTA